MATILLIDDEVQVLGLFCEVLEAEGYEILMASDGRQGLDLYDLHRPEIVITDLVLPRVSGLEVVRRLGSEARTRVIAVSGSGRGHLERAVELGAALVLAKPVAIQDLIDGVRQLASSLGASE